MSKKSKIFIPDTNVPLHDSSCIYQFHEHDVVMPIQVIEELDTFKKGFETKNFHAREFCRILDELSSGEIFNGGVSLGPNLGKLKISLAVPWDDKITKNLRVLNVDAEIINLGYVLQQNNQDKDVIIVSKDINLRLKAKALGVMAEDFLYDTVPNISILTEEVREIEVSSALISSIYKNTQPTPHVIKDAIENQNFILKSSKQSALVRYQNGALKCVQKEYVFNIKAKNSEQAFMMDILMDENITLAAFLGKAGTGKTLVSIASGLHQLDQKKYDEFSFTRKTISMGNHDIGFLPGGIDDKMNPYMMAMDDNIKIINSANVKNEEKINKFRDSKKFLMQALPFIRGRSLHKTFFIIDEAQNLTPFDVKTIVTRAGEGTKVVLIGDIDQIDEPFLDQKSNGLSYLIDRFRGQPCFGSGLLVKGERSALAELASKLL